MLTRKVSWSGVGRLVSYTALAVAMMGSTTDAQARTRHWFYRHGPVAYRHHPLGGTRHVGSSFAPQGGPAFAAMVVDANSGRTLYAVNEDAPRHPASITKVMTLYLLFDALEKGRLRLDSPLMVSVHAAAQSPTKLGLRPGSTISVENAIKAIVTKSANDMAVAVAENLAGAESSFAEAMTARAHALGMNHTFYHNASGLPDDRQLTTARDLTILGRAIHDRFPHYYHYFSTPSFTYAGSFMANHNHLLGRVEGMDGIKTGYTNASGFNLLSSVNRDGRHIVSVVLGGRTAAGRDRIMESLIETHIEEASATPTTRIAEASPIEEPASTPNRRAEPEPIERQPPPSQIYAADDAADPEADGPIERQPPRGPNLIAPDLAIPAPAMSRQFEHPRNPRDFAMAAERTPPPERARPTASVTFAAEVPAPLPPGPHPSGQRPMGLHPLPPPSRPPEDRPRPAFIAGAPKVIDPSRLPGPLAAAERRRLAMDGSTNRRPIVAAASAAAIATTTPSSLRWVAGAQPVRFGPSAQAAAAAKAKAGKAGNDVPTGSIVDHSTQGETEIARAGPARAEAAPDAMPPLARGGWVIQIGATDDADKANDLLIRAKSEGRSALAAAHPFTEKVQKGEATLYRARFAGLDPNEAEVACKTLKRSGFACFATHN